MRAIASLLACSAVLMGFSAANLQAEEPARVRALPKSGLTGHLRPATEYLVHLKVAERAEDPRAAKAKVRCVSEPTIAVKEGVSAELQAGGSTVVGDEEIEFGTFARISVTRARDGFVDVKGKVEVSNLGAQTPDSAVRESTTVCFKRTFPLNKSVRIVLKDSASQGLWCDMKVEETELDPH